MAAESVMAPPEDGASDSFVTGRVVILVLPPKENMEAPADGAFESPVAAVLPEATKAPLDDGALESWDTPEANEKGGAVDVAVLLFVPKVTVDVDEVVSLLAVVVLPGATPNTKVVAADVEGAIVELPFVVDAAGAAAVGGLETPKETPALVAAGAAAPVVGLETPNKNGAAGAGAATPTSGLAAAAGAALADEGSTPGRGLLHAGHLS